MNKSHGGLWVPDDPHPFGASLDEVSSSYMHFLEIRYPLHHKQFKKRLAADQDAAKAEAVIFSWLRNQSFEPQLAESPITGGADFLCRSFSKPLMLIEVTTLNKKAVEIKSGWPDTLDIKAKSFGMITTSLWSKAKSKVPQLANADVPRILVVCLSHQGASALVGSLAAKWLMISTPKIKVPIAKKGESAAPQSETDLKNAAFFRIKDGKIVPVRRSISAILLVALWNKQLDVVGILHPDPVVELDYSIFHDIPFLRIKWPILGAQIQSEWVIGSPKPNREPYRVITLTDAELKGE